MNLIIKREDKHTEVMKDALNLTLNIQMQKMEGLIDVLPLSKPVDDVFVNELKWQVHKIVDDVKLAKVCAGTRHLLDLVSREGDVKITFVEASLLAQACDIYSRTMVGQWREFEAAISGCLKGGVVGVPHNELIKLGVILSKSTISNVDGWTSNLGIYSDKVSDDARIGFEIYKVLISFMSWEEAYASEEAVRGEDRDFSKFMTVNYDAPMKMSQVDFIGVSLAS